MYFHSPPAVIGPMGYGMYGATAQPCIRRGAQGPAVTALQTALRSLGFNSDGSRTYKIGETVVEGDKEISTELDEYRVSNLAVDGDFGGGTEKALKAFQTSVGVTSDGIAGPNTWTKLGSSGLPCGSSGGGSSSGGGTSGGSSSGGSGTYVDASGKQLPTGFGDTPFYKQTWFYWTAGLGGAAILAILLWPKGKK